MQLSQTEKKILNIFFHLRNLNKIWKSLKKKLTVVGDFFLKL